MQDFLIRGSLLDLDPRVADLSEIESERQYRRLILIPSESSAPMAVREALSSAFQNIYAEGYPDEDTRWMNEEQILDYGKRLATYRRYSDPRYYKGVEYADTVEELARRRCAEAFAANGLTADDIYVNVQALSGGPANNAVYHALVKPGDTVLGMNLLHGGHLSHGSHVNRSGKFHNIIQYGVDAQTEKIDYDEIEALAQEHKPRMIIAGFSSYSWTLDWHRFRQIADSVGALLLADIAHVAGLVAADQFPSPIGIADVVTFTTHKSLCGPRGAAILTFDNAISRKIDRAVFPGEQGGPHINTMLAQATAFKLAQTEQFVALQKQILVNSKVMTETLEKEGFRIPFGGTNTHLFNIDCSNVVGADGTKLSGDAAARILDIVGIVVNRNTIPGDKSAASPSGVRLGTPWITQRGFTEKESAQLAKIIADVLSACQPFSVATRRGSARRARINYEVLNQAKIDVRDLSQSLGIDFEASEHGYPHFYYLDDPLPQGSFAQIDIEGEQAATFLRWTTSGRPGSLHDGGAAQVKIHAPAGTVEAILSKKPASGGFTISLGVEDVAKVLTWLRDLSDGYITFDHEDIQKKINGPVVVSLTGSIDQLPEASDAHSAQDKPWYIGINGAEGEALPEFEWNETEDASLYRTALYDTHVALGAKMVPFAGWEMPVWYSSVVDEHLATRNTAGLFDVTHMGVYQVEGTNACAFLDSVVTNDVALLSAGESLYTQFLDPDGSVIDDLLIYHYRDEAYLVVVNASNDDKDWAWLNAVKNGQVRIDSQRSWAKAFGRDCILRNLRDPKEGRDMRVDIALQGPESRNILLAMGCDAETSEALMHLKWGGVMQGVVGGFDLIISRTGYTGERMAFELFIHPDQSVDFWKGVLAAGEPFGVLPVGLGARDSLRTEAGLPLYGHEMGGEMNLNVAEAGFGSFVKLHKPWFIGRAAYVGEQAQHKSVVARFRFVDKGVRMAHTGDPVVDSRGRVIGHVTSCAVDQEGYLLGQAYLQNKYAVAGTSIGIFQSASNQTGKAPSELKVGDRITIPTPAKVLTRFPSRKKKV
jgi:glycine hydroxymethyltransferase